MITELHNNSVLETGPLERHFKDLVVQKECSGGSPIGRLALNYFEIREYDGVIGDHLHVVLWLLRKGVDVVLGEILAEVRGLERGRVVAANAGRRGEGSAHHCVVVWCDVA